MNEARVRTSRASTSSSGVALPRSRMMIGQIRPMAYCEFANNSRRRYYSSQKLLVCNALGNQSCEYSISRMVCTKTASAPKRSVICRGKIDTKERWWEKDTHVENVKTVYNTENFLYQLSLYRDKLVIVDFFATWCGSCRALYPKLLQLVEENDTVVLLKVNFDENKPMSKSLGVKVLPFFMLYRGAEGKVDQFSASISKIQRLRSAIQEHSTPFCSLGPVPNIPELEKKKNGEEDDAEHDTVV